MHPTRLAAIALSVASVTATHSARAQHFSVPLSNTVDVGTTASAANVTLNMTGQGSGTNGPETAQFGVNLSCAKDNYQTTNSVGEIDCLNISLHQGGPGSDSSGILIGVENTGLGYANDMEMVVSQLDTSNDSTPYYEDIQIGSITSDQQMVGATFNAVSGAGGPALYVNAEGSSSWGTVLQAAKGGAIYFRIDGSGNVTTTGSVQTASLTTSGAVRAEGGIVKAVAQSGVLSRDICGATLRSTASGPVTLVVPSGLPIGCRVNVIQASDGAVTFEGQDMRAEHLGTPAGADVRTSGRYAEAQLLIDSPKTFLLRGDVGTGHPRTVDFVSDIRPADTDAVQTLLQ